MHINVVAQSLRFQYNLPNGHLDLTCALSSAIRAASLPPKLPNDRSFDVRSAGAAPPGARGAVLVVNAFVIDAPNVESDAFEGPALLTLTSA